MNADQLTFGSFATEISLVQEPTRAAFVARQKSLLNAWSAELTIRDRPIVALTRKGPRLIELGVREGVMQPVVLEHLTTERAMVLGLVPLRDEVVLADDAVSFGSTFTRFMRIARSLYQPARVLGLPFACATELNADRRTFVDNAQLALGPESVVSFVNAEVAAFAALAKPYDIDHPILYLPLARHLAWADLETQLHAIALRIGASAYQTPRRVSMSSGETRTYRSWSVVFEVTSSEREAAQFRKIRCYFDPHDARLAIVPIAPSTASLDDLEHHLRVCAGPIAQAWAAVRDRRSVAISPDHAWLQRQALVTWANYLLEFALLKGDLQALGRGLADAGLASGALDLATGDVRMLVGSEADRITPLLRRWLEDSDARIPVVARPTTTPRARLPEAHRAKYEQKLAELLRGADQVEDVLGASFWAQHIGIELPSRKTAPDDPQRLEFGVHVRLLEQLVTERLGSWDPLSFHRTLDTLIDQGTAVPRFLPDNGTDTEVWFRAFRAGEGLQALGSLVLESFRSLAHELDTPTLPAVIFEKHLALVVLQRAAFRDEALDTAEQTYRGWYHYGGRAMVQISYGRPLVRWATAKLLLARSGKAFIEHPQAREQLPEVRLAPRTIKSLRDLARWSKDALEQRELSSAFLIAAASVETASSYEHALRAEIREWAANVRDLLSKIGDGLRNGRTRPSNNVSADAKQMAEWLVQAQIKHELFVRWPALFSAADRHWPEGGTDTADTWRLLVRPTLVETAQQRAPMIPMLQEFVLVAGRLNTLLRNALDLYANTAPTGPVIDACHDVRTAVADCSAWLPEALGRAMAQLGSIDPDGDPVATMWRVARAVEEFADVADELVATTEQVGPALEVVRDHRYICHWDLIGSTEDESAPTEQRRVEVHRRVCDGAIGRIGGLDPNSTDDGHIGVCRTTEDTVWFIKRILDRHAPFFHVAVGVTTTLEAPLHRVTETHAYSGPAIYRAARLKSLFTELEGPKERWTRPDRRPTRPGGSYVIASGPAADELQFGKHGFTVTEPDGQYILRTGSHPTTRVVIATPLTD